MSKRIKGWVRRLVGLHYARIDHVNLEQQINYRANITDKRLDSLEAKIEDLTGNLAFLSSMFGHNKDNDEPMTHDDLRTSNPWDAT